MQSPPNLSNVKYLHTLVSRHPICVHGQLDCISSQSPFTRSIWARIWVRKIEANIKSETYYSSVTVQELAVKNPFTHLRVRCRTNLNLESLFRGVCKKKQNTRKKKTSRSITHLRTRYVLSPTFCASHGEGGTLRFLVFLCAMNSVLVIKLEIAHNILSRLLWF